MKLSRFVPAVLALGAGLLASCTTVVEKPAPTTEVRTRHTQSSTTYPASPMTPAVSTSTETRSVRAE
jgi:hypothetical protein